MTDEKRGNFNKVRGILKPERKALVEKVAEWLYNDKYPSPYIRDWNSFNDKCGPKINFRAKARELIALIQPTDVLAEIRELADEIDEKLEPGFSGKNWIRKKLSNIIALCTSPPDKPNKPDEPTDVLAEIRELANDMRTCAIQYHPDYFTAPIVQTAMENIIALCTPEPAKQTVRDEIAKIICAFEYRNAKTANVEYMISSCDLWHEVADRIMAIVERDGDE